MQPDSEADVAVFISCSTLLALQLLLKVDYYMCLLYWQTCLDLGFPSSLRPHNVQLIIQPDGHVRR